SDTPNDAISSVVILEFKRPMRDHFTDDDNPIDQVTNYVQLLLENKETSGTGRPITIRPGTPFYCYILCDLTPDSRKMFLGRGYNLTPDGDGFFNFNKNYNAYIEIILYNK